MPDASQQTGPVAGSNTHSETLGARIKRKRERLFVGRDAERARFQRLIEGKAGARIVVVPKPTAASWKSGGDLKAEPPLIWIRYRFQGGIGRGVDVDAVGIKNRYRIGRLVTDESNHYAKKPASPQDEPPPHNRRRADKV